MPPAWLEELRVAACSFSCWGVLTGVESCRSFWKRRCGRLHVLQDIALVYPHGNSSKVRWASGGEKWKVEYRQRQRKKKYKNHWGWPFCSPPPLCFFPFVELFVSFSFALLDYYPATPLISSISINTIHNVSKSRVLRVSS